MFVYYCFSYLLLVLISMKINCIVALNMPPLDQKTSNNPWPSEGGSKRHISDYKARENHPTSYDDSPAFKGPIVLERPSSTSEHHTRLSHYYSQNGLVLSKQEALHPKSPTSLILQTIVDHFAYHDAPVDVKEICESIEFYARTRKRMFGAAKKKRSRITGKKNPTNYSVNVLDCCAGHGLTGMLFSACNPGKEVYTTLVDSIEPPSHQILRDLLVEICPWVEGRVSFYTMKLKSYQEFCKLKGDKEETLPVVIATHACGSLTDQVLELGVDLGACGLATMPCCYTGTSKDTPYGIKRALGVSWAADIRRSFFLTEKGYHTDFATIPSEITPMNRIIVGELRD
mmetsp:Transcript_8223/g.12280  ORF Transcript_8223/g.12280 Transcript_8223/m.12280 type:complete len:343 (-) Transcript_8223:271-1299(-)